MNYDDYGNESIIPNEMMKELIEHKKEKLNNPKNLSDNINSCGRSALRFTSQYMFCPNFFTCDTYDGCEHKCKYCFAYHQKLLNASSKNTGEKFFFNILTRNINNIPKFFNKESVLNEYEQKIKHAINLNMPMHIGGSSDPCQPVELKYKQTKKLLTILNEHKYPFILSTKNKIINDYIDLFHKKSILQVSLIGNTEKVEKIETGSSKTEERIDTIRNFSKNHYTVVRLQPFIPGLLTDQELDDFIRILKSTGVNSITSEIVKLYSFENRKLNIVSNEISTILGYNIKSYFKTQRKPLSDELKDLTKIKHMLKVKEICKKYNIDFYSADNSFRILGKGANCCGYEDEMLGSKHTQYMNRAPFIAKEKGEVKFQDIYNEPTMLLKFVNVGNFLNTGTNYKYFKNASFLDLIKRNWNDPKSPTNPSNFFTNLVDSGRKEDGMNIYYHDKNWLNKLLSQKNLMSFINQKR
jgi:DNA repair photolyase